VAVVARQAVLPDGSARVSVEVRNTGVPLAEPVHEGVGLANTRERLRHHFGPLARLRLGARDGQTVALLAWPAATVRAADPASPDRPSPGQPPSSPLPAPDPSAPGSVPTAAASPEPPRLGPTSP
jgi:hypothetical protein